MTREEFVAKLQALTLEHTECRAEKPGPSERSQRLSRPEPCYDGQWTVHGEHDYETRVANWLGGGTTFRHCPGKTPGDRAGPERRRPVMRTAQVLSRDCSGPNAKCRCAARNGKPVHVIPTPMGPMLPALVMPTYHYATEEEGLTAIREAFRTAPTVYGDADLELYRNDGVPHFLPVGWVDPSMRRD